VAGADRVVNQGEEVVLDGASSTHPAGEIVAYQWMQAAGTSVALTGADTATASFLAPQTEVREDLVFRLSVRDAAGVTGSDTVTITVNVPPTANAGPDQAWPLSVSDTRTIILSGVSSDDEGVVAHQWVQIGGPDVTLSGAETPTATFGVDGASTQAYTFRYTVTDGDGAPGSGTVAVYINKVIILEAFADGPGWGDRWAPVNETALSAAWAVDSGGGVLRQSNNVVNGAFLAPTSYHLGTYAVFDPSIIPPSYRFSVDIRPLTDISGTQGNDVGILFRYQDPGNYYRVSRSARYGFTRFEKREEGVFQTLAVNAMGYVDNQPMTMMVEVKDDTSIVWIDGEPVFAVADSGIAPGTVGLYCQDRAEFDNVLITENPLQPVVAISTPLAYSVALTQDDGDMLAVEAVVLNQPDGGTVRFTLDGGQSAAGASTGNVHAGQFAGVADGEHDIMAVLRDAGGKEVGHDINSMVGSGGDYYVSVGDSITDGLGDADPSDNDSADGRIVAIQGYQASLADLLTTATGRPQIVFNEGIAGELSLGLSARIDSILERHPGANRVLLMIGTNDSNGGVTAVNFQNNVIETINHLNGRTVWLAQLLPAYINESPMTWILDMGRNTVILEYNTAMRAIAASNPDDGIFTGPDFFQDPFLSIPEAVYNDYLHPNHAGYQAMADGWHNVLKP
jgi:lysophospholipase L1-like esterase